MRLVVILIGMMAFLACRQEAARIPRPRAYPRVHYPVRQIQSFSLDQCPMTFQYPDYMTVIRRDRFSDDDTMHPCWFDLDAGVFGATLHCSYSDISGEQTFDALVSDAFRIADKINQRANYMDEVRVANEHGVSGLLMEFSGSAASPLHFFLTDSTAHFLKASLYFQSKYQADSLAPVMAYLRQDLALIINTMTFE